MKKTLVIMAAGMGSRYGGLKQIESFGPNNELIIDYSIFDAIRVGFDKVIFIIKEENYELFKEKIGDRISKYIKVEYAFQKLDDVLKGYNIPSERIKPLGTAHAIYSARDLIDSDFAVINADDFYGYEAFKVLSETLDKASSNEYVMVCYKVCNTITLNGSVKRGVCLVEDGYLKGIDESVIEVIDDKIYKTSMINNDTSVIDKDTLVSMNLFGFKKDFINYIIKDFKDFLDNSDLSVDEFFLPSVVFNCIKRGDAKVKVYSTDEKTYGVTYKEDKIDVIKGIENKIKEGVYPKKLWK